MCLEYPEKLNEEYCKVGPDKQELVEKLPRRGPAQAPAKGMATAVAGST